MYSPCPYVHDSIQCRTDESHPGLVLASLHCPCTVEIVDATTTSAQVAREQVVDLGKRDVSETQ